MRGWLTRWMAQTAATLTTSLAVPGGSWYIDGGGHVLRTLVWIVSTTRAAPGCDRHQKPKGQSLAIPRAGQAGPTATKRVPRRQLWPPMGFPGRRQRPSASDGTSYDHTAGSHKHIPVEPNILAAFSVWPRRHSLDNQSYTHRSCRSD